MKTVYIPKGETVIHESLVTEHLVVEGCLQVAYSVKAKTISGNGIIQAGSVSADVIRIGDLEADTIICERLIAKRVESPEVFVSGSAVASCYLSAAYVKAGKLTVTVSEVDTVEADEVIHLTPQRHNLFGTLLLSALRAFWLRLCKPASSVMDAQFVPVSSELEEKPLQDHDADSLTEVNVMEPSSGEEKFVTDERSVPVDEELNRFINLFKLSREAGFTLRIVPGTPEENAPVFDFENESIVRPAA